MSVPADRLIARARTFMTGSRAVLFCCSLPPITRFLRGRTAWFGCVAVASLLGLSASAVAQQYFNFELASGGKVLFRGSLITSVTPNGTAGTLSGLANSASYYYPGGGTTAYGVTSSAAYGSTTFGTYEPNGSLYYVSSANFGFQAGGSYFIVEGTAQNEKSAGFTLYAATYNSSTNTYTKSSPVATNSGIKALAAGTETIYGEFSNTTATDVPEIDGGSLPRAMLLFFCALALASSLRLRKRLTWRGTVKTSPARA